MWLTMASAAWSGTLDQCFPLTDGVWSQYVVSRHNQGVVVYVEEYTHCDERVRGAGHQPTDLPQVDTVAELVDSVLSRGVLKERPQIELLTNAVRLRDGRSAVFDLKVDVDPASCPSVPEEGYVWTVYRAESCVFSQMLLKHHVFVPAHIQFATGLPELVSTVRLHDVTVLEALIAIHLEHGFPTSLSMSVEPGRQPGYLRAIYGYVEEPEPPPAIPGPTPEEERARKEADAAAVQYLNELVRENRERRSQGER